jgi:hypothetical protein
MHAKFWCVTLMLLLQLLAFGGAFARSVGWSNPKVLKRRKHSLERARAIVRGHDNLEDLLVDSLTTLTDLLAPMIEQALSSTVMLAAQAERDLGKGSYDSVLKSKYFTSIVLELRRVLPYVSSFPAIDSVLKITNVGMRRFAIKVRSP